MVARLTSIVCVALAGALASVSAQQGAPGPSTEGLVRKGKAPISTDILNVKLPRPQEGDLPNGLHLMVLEDRRVPRITFQIIIPGAGGYYDPADRAGLAGYTAAMMREGTAKLSSVQLSQELETIAGVLNLSAGFSTPNASMSGSALTEHFDRVFQIAGDVLLNPSFTAEEWERFKTREKAQLQQQRTQPGFLSRELFNRVVYGGHPASRISATTPSLDAITREALAEFHRTRYLPDHAAIAFAGDITFAEARQKVETSLGGWRKAGSKKPTVSDPPPAGAPKVYLVSRPGSVQTTLVTGMQSMTPPASRLRGTDSRQPGARGARWDVSSGTCARARGTPTESAAAFGIRLSGRLVCLHVSPHRGDGAGAHRFARRDCGDARPAGAGRRVGRCQALDRRLVCPVA